MRHFVRRDRFQVTDPELELVETVLFSGFFILIDLFFFSLLFTFMTMPIHSSIIGAIFVFLSFYSLGACLYLFLRKWLHD